MKTSLIKLLAKENITKPQYEAALHYFHQDISILGKNTVIHDWIEITESARAGYYDVQYSYHPDIFKIHQDTFKFTKEEYLTI